MMDKLQHIDTKKLVMTLLSLFVFALLYLSVGHKLDKEVGRVNVRISKINQSRNLINKKDVTRIFRGYLGYDVSMATVRDLDLKMLEQVLEDDKRVRKAELFVDAKSVLHVFVKQRRPIVRLNSGEVYNYYLDKEGIVIPVKKGNALRVPIATGAIEEVKIGFGVEGSTNLKKVLSIAKFIDKDEFLKALVEQIHVKNNNEIIIIPKIGREKIVLGDVNDMSVNFNKLKEFYRNGLPKSGWGKFAELNLTYKNQVLAVKR